MKLFEEIYKKAKLRKKTFYGTCVNTDLYNDATEMAQDLGYYAAFDNYENPDDSNFLEISKEEFIEECPDFNEFSNSKDKWLFLKRFDKSIYVAYNENEDIHYFFI